MKIQKEKLSQKLHCNFLQREPNLLPPTTLSQFTNLNKNNLILSTTNFYIICTIPNENTKRKIITKITLQFSPKGA